MRALVLTALFVTGLAALAQAGNDGMNIGSHPTVVIEPQTTPPPAPEPAPVAVQQPAVQAAPAPAPAPAPVAAVKPWPENVPSLKPGSEKVVAATTKAPKAAGGSTAPSKAAAAGGTGQGQQAALPPAPANAASLTPTRVTLQAAIVAGAPPLREPLQWTIRKPGSSNKKLGAEVASMTGPRGEFSIPPGDYVVTIKQRDAVVSQPLTVGSVAVVKTITLNTSIVGVRVLPYTGGRIVTDPVHWEVFSMALGRPGPDSKVADTVAPETSFTLPAGYYVVRSHYQDVSSDLAMLVEPGIRYSYTVVLYAASISGQAVGPTGKPVTDVKWQVVRKDAETDGSHAVVATHSGANPNFLVREGSYMVIATGADGSVGQTPISVKAGKPVKVRVVLKPAATTATTSTNG